MKASHYVFRSLNDKLYIYAYSIYTAKEYLCALVRDPETWFLESIVDVE